MSSRKFKYDKVKDTRQARKDVGLEKHIIENFPINSNKSTYEFVSRRFLKNFNN